MDVEEALAREAIRKSLGRYTIEGDRGRLDELALAFAEDGVLALGDVESYEGRHEIVRGLSARVGGEGIRFMRHHLTSSQIEVTGPEQARARTYFIVFSDVGLDHAGVYEDRLRRVGAEWLIAHRTVRLDWASESSVFPSEMLRALMRPDAG